MNLWVNRVGQTILLWASALFFLSCEDETGVLGYKAKDRFNVYYAEIPIESSVYQYDSLVTTNFNLPSEVHRWLVGTYQDARVGTVTSETYAEFYPTNIGDSLAFGTYDSVTLQLNFESDFAYGSSGKTPQEIAIYELDDTLTRAYYFPSYFSNNEPIPVKPMALATKTYNETPVDAGENLNMRIPLNFEFGQRLFESARRFQTATSPADSSFIKYTERRNEFKGIAIKPVQGDKIVSFNPLSPNTKIIVHYHKNQPDSIVLSFANIPNVVSVTSFNRIQADRSGSELEGLPPYYQEFQPDKRYIHNPTGVTTKLDFSNFLAFADSASRRIVSSNGQTDTIPGTIIINSAELVITGVEDDGDDLYPPEQLALRILKNNNRFKLATSDEAALSDRALYKNTITTSYTVVSDLNWFSGQPTSVGMEFDKTDNTYSGHLTLFLQELYRREEENPVFSNLALYSVNPTPAKTVSRAVFANNIKLKISYTKPLNNQ